MIGKSTKIPIKSFHSIALCLLSFVVALWVGSCSSSPTQAVNLNFGAAGIVRNPMEEINVLYEQENPHIVINSIFAGSGVIERAVERGEPFDGVLFGEISSLHQLQVKKLIVPKSDKEILTTDIVLIAPADSPLQISSFQELADNRIKTVAIGNQNLAVGTYTKTLLTRMGINNIVTSKAIWAKGDVREILKLVEQGEAAVGITFLSETKTSNKVKILATAAKDLYEPIRCSIGIIQTSANQQEIKAYLDFLTTDRAMAIFKKFGMYPTHSIDKSHPGDNN